MTLKIISDAPARAGCTAWQKAATNISHENR
jgi:hypothetical protein